MEGPSRVPRTESGAADSAVGWTQPFAALRYGSYRLLWSSTLLTSGGNWIQQITIGWLALQVTHSPFQVGAITGLRGLPMLVMGPPSGVLADRIDRRKILLASQLFLALSALIFTAIIWTDHLQVWHMYAFSLATGVGWAIQNPVRQSLVANSVPRRDLPNAIALNSTAFNAMRIVGPGVGGALIAAFGFALNFGIQAVAYLGVFVLVLFFRPLEVNDSTAARTQSAFANLQEGFRYVLANRVILSLIATTMTVMVFVMSFASTQMPVYAQNVLATGATGLGFLLMAYGVGGLIGALLAASIGAIRRKGVLVFSAATLLALTAVVFSQTTSMVPAVIILVVMGAFQMLTNASTNATIQSIIPDRIRGRVMGIYMISVGMMPVGSLIAGALAEGLHDVARAFLVGGIVSLCLLAVLIVSAKQVRELRV